MKKVLAIFILLTFMTPAPAMAGIYFGMYKPETEYGLVDGFKINLGRKKEGEKRLQIRSETKEEQARLEWEKGKPKVEQNEYEMFRFMRENTVPF